MKLKYVSPVFNKTVLSGEDILNGSDVLIDIGNLFDEQSEQN